VPPDMRMNRRGLRTARLSPPFDLTVVVKDHDIHLPHRIGLRPLVTSPSYIFVAVGYVNCSSRLPCNAPRGTTLGPRPGMVVCLLEKIRPSRGYSGRTVIDGIGFQVRASGGTDAGFGTSTCDTMRNLEYEVSRMEWCGGLYGACVVLGQGLFLMNMSWILAD